MGAHGLSSGEYNLATFEAVVFFMIIQCTIAFLAGKSSRPLK